MPHPKGFIRVALDLDKGMAEIVLPRGISGCFIWKSRKILLTGGRNTIPLQRRDFLQQQSRARQQK
jgi:hypothetical protein